MLRIIFRSLAVCFVIAGIVLYVAYLQTGRLWQPWLSFSMPSWVSGSPNMQALEAPTEPTWRWRQNGVWHYGDKPPVGVEAKRIDKHSIAGQGQH